MNRHIEKELKIMLKKEEFVELLSHYDFEEIHQTNEYFNTFSKTVGMRIRALDNQYIFTLKEYKNNQTYEYEKVLDTPSLNDQDVIKLLNHYAIQNPFSLGIMQTIRYRKALKRGELVLDHSFYLGIEDYELEYEYYDSEDTDTEEIDAILAYLKDYHENEISKLGRFIERRKKMKVAILCANGLEECEALVVYDLLKRADLEVELVNIHDTNDILSAHQLCFKTDLPLKDFHGDDYSAIILPGGMPGTTHLQENKMVIKLIHQFYQEKKLIGAICAAPSILIDEGYLKDEEFVCYPSFERQYKAQDKKVVIQDNIITAKALGAAFEFAHAIIKALKDEEIANHVLEQIYY